jgi:hypothetical protein
MYCFGCGIQNAKGLRFYTPCGTMLPLGSTGGVASPAPTAQPVLPKNLGVAAVLSFSFAGLGQIYNADWQCSRHYVRLSGRFLNKHDSMPRSGTWPIWFPVDAANCPPDNPGNG